MRAVAIYSRSRIESICVAMQRSGGGIIGRGIVCLNFGGIFWIWRGDLSEKVLSGPGGEAEDDVKVGNKAIHNSLPGLEMLMPLLVSC